VYQCRRGDSFTSPQSAENFPTFSAVYAKPTFHEIEREVGF
jgi:hypothetical protein